MSLSPFGNPDGSTEPLQDLMSHFVTFRNEARWGGLAMTANDRSARIIVGRKGSGKTAYLRRLHANATGEESLFVTSWCNAWLSTETVVRFCQLFEPEYLVDTWERVWRVAILQSAASHLLHQPSLRAHFTPAILDRFARDFADFLSPAAEDPHTRANAIIVAHPSRNRLTGFLEQGTWAHLEARLGTLLSGCPPVCIAMDALDEKFEQAPQPWLSCQRGLMYAILSILRNHVIGSRLHIYATIRDIVFGSVLRSEHRSRYEHDAHIKVLRWNHDAARHFLEQKIAQLPPECFVGDSHERTVSGWLGRSSIQTARKSKRGGHGRECVIRYILRHTRLLPRDIIMIGNALCARIVASKEAATGAADLDQMIRRVMSDRARAIAEEQLQTCSRELEAHASDQFSRRLSPRSTAAGTSDTTYQQVKHVLERVGKDKFSQSVLDKVRRDLAKDNPSATENDVFSVLWRNGMIGCTAKIAGRDEWVFFTDTRPDQYTLPTNMRQYGFHSCLLDCARITPVGPRPVEEGAPIDGDDENESSA